MARDYLKAVIKSTVMDCKSDLDMSETCEDDVETASESNHSQCVRSPGALRGRSVKEVEEQLGNLKKENFNLKLRIYFLEERMGSNFNLDKENVVKKNVELMVELESLKKELQEKHELLCQAVKAMELEDEEHKKVINEKEGLIGECQLEIESLKNQLSEIKQDCDTLTHRSCHSAPAEYFPSQAFSMQEKSSKVIKELQEKISCLEDELNEEKENMAAIQIVLSQKDTKINSMLVELEEANQKLTSREEEIKGFQSHLQQTKDKLKKLQERSQQATDETPEISELRKKQALLVADLERERKRYEKLKTSSDQKISDLQSKLETSLSELKKSQDLVVSKSPARRPGNTDADSFSVPKSATSPGSPQKDTFDLPTVPSPIVSPTTSPSPSRIFDTNPDLKQIIEQLTVERDAQQQKIVKLKAEQMKACKIIKGMIDSRNKSNEEIMMLKKRNEELEQELEGAVVKLTPEGKKLAAVSTSNMSDDENAMAEQGGGESLEHYKAVANELEEKNRLLASSLNEKETQIKTFQEQLEEISRDLKEKEDRIVDLEFELLAQNQERKVDGEPSDKSLYLQQLQEKDEEIERLNTKLLKLNCDLQVVVNNELWERNREIEKLQKKQVAKVVENKDEEISKLQKNLTLRDAQLELIKAKISEIGIEIDLQNGDINIDNNLQSQLEKSEKLRHEANEVVGILGQRLEELAIFLDSLLKQKSVLGFLGHKENKRIREIIDHSLDLSRTFTMSMIINPDQSLLQLTNISSVLNNTEEIESNQLSLLPGEVSLTYRSHLYKKNDNDNSQVIDVLRQQIVNLKYELQLRDIELSKLNNDDNPVEISSDKGDNLTKKSALNTTSTTLKYKSDNQSESEAWSEPDRSVSRARMGLTDNSLKSNTSKKTLSHISTDSTEDEEFDRNSRTPTKKGILNESRVTIMELHKRVCELDQKLNEKENAYYEAAETNCKLKHELENLRIQLLDTESKLAQAEDKKTEAELKAENLKKEKDDLLAGLTEKNKELLNKINQIEVEKSEALSVAQEAEEVAEIAKNEMKAAEMRIGMVQEEMRTLEVALRNDYEERLKEKVKLIEEEALQKIECLQHEAEMEIETLNRTLTELQIDCANNYMKKVDVEQTFQEIGRLRSVIVELEEQIEEVSRSEKDAKEKISEFEEKVNVLRADLDNATLQYSEAVLEKTKIANEKALIEQEVNRGILKEMDYNRRIDEIENELVTLKQNHQKQVSVMFQERSRLEVRISELESCNAELHNRLIKIQTGCGDNVFSSSLPNTSNFVNQIVSFRRQHSDNSSYVSEDQMFEDLRNSRNFNNKLVPIQNVDIERHEANSSPDLGIESDHGRFSSLETHLNVSRPLLQTLELTESMSNLLDPENNQVRPITCDNDHCCQRTMEMAHENTDLKRKLLRTRRALEETVTQLSLANQRKKQVEKTICKQIHKTSQVLRKAKANLDSGSETDVYKK